MEIYFNILQPPARHHNCLGICIYSNIAMFPMNITSHIIMWVLGLVEFALLKVKLCFAQLIKYEFEMLLVLFDRIAKYKYIIKIYVYESSDEILEDYRHKTLKCSGSIAISLLHCMAHEGAIDGSECGFPHVARFHTYLFIRVGHIDF